MRKKSEWVSEREVDRKRARGREVKYFVFLPINTSTEDFAAILKFFLWLSAHFDKFSNPLSSHLYALLNNCTDISFSLGDEDESRNFSSCSIRNFGLIILSSKVACHGSIFVSSGILSLSKIDDPPLDFCGVFVATTLCWMLLVLIMKTFRTTTARITLIMAILILRVLNDDIVVVSDVK